jgi:hypothetical protein
MARNRQLTQLIDDLRAEVGHAVSASVGVDNLPSLKRILRRTQDSLYEDFDWPHLRVLPTKAMAAGQRYYDFPTDLNYERIEEVVIWYSGQPHGLVRGIGFGDYAQYDSDSGDRSDPQLKWDIRHTGTNEQMEIWPIPSSNSNTVQFKGIRPLGDLIADADTCDLDGNLIVLFAAAEILTRQKSEDAQAKLAAANSLYLKLKGRTKGATKMAVLGGGNDTDLESYRGHTIIRVS